AAGLDQSFKRGEERFAPQSPVPKSCRDGLEQQTLWCGPGSEDSRVVAATTTLTLVFHGRCSLEDLEHHGGNRRKTNRRRDARLISSNSGDDGPGIYREGWDPQPV